MSALSRKLREAESGIAGCRLLHFWCPGCDMVHGVRVRAGEGPGVCWGWNGDVERPTFSPSVLVQYFRASELGERQMREGTLKPGERADGRDMVCHSFVESGRIRFLGDCTHSLAGQEVELPNWTEIGE